MKPKALALSVIVITFFAGQCKLVASAEENQNSKANVNGEASKAAKLNAGQAKARTVCAACHGVNGISVADHIPNLAGQRAGYLMGQLNALKDKSRKHDVMNPIAAQLSEIDIENLAAYFAAQPVVSAEIKSAFMPNFTQSKVSIPENYQASFIRYHAVQSAEDNTMTIYYANDKAIAAAKAGKPLPEGAIIIAENNTAKMGADKKPIVGSDGFFVADKMTSYAAMARDTNWGDDIPELLRNENWQYGLFNTARELRQNISYAECFACHKALDKSSFVFTLKRMAASHHGSVKVNK